MDRARYSFIAHQKLVYCNPIGAARMDRVLEHVPLARGMRVLDIGAGTGELLIRLIERHGVRGVAVEREALFVAEMRRRAEVRGVSDSLEAVSAAAAEFVREAASGSFDAAFCIGASHALGDYTMTLRTLSRLVKPGGHVVMGEGYWKKPPDPEYLASFGGTAEEMSTHAANVEEGVAMGLIPLFATTASQDEWDEYEWTYSANIEKHLMEHPDDPDADQMRERCRAWRSGYLRWGRETMGFGVYVFGRG